ncbi:hypothetical protein [Actinoplanes missouriensis]|uniref:hypothetical protein n=1 Tax=Actinoplanes missouriensis TaxID=1866 RepID=UPI0002DAB5B1|nr:hypothetical protein [Actinoplanes missouriensis]
MLSAKAGCTNVTGTAVLSAPMPTKGYAYSGVGVDVFPAGYSTKFTAIKTGTWKVVYAGSGTKATASATDAVKVK